MSIIDTIISYMRSCPAIDDNSMITVDRYAMTDGYSIAPNGYTILKQYTRSQALVSRRYVISITCPADTDTQRRVNAETLEAIEKWLFNQARKKDFPSIGKQVMAMTASNGMAYDDMENGYTMYQVQIQINYVEECDKE